MPVELPTIYTDHSDIKDIGFLRSLNRVKAKAAIISKLGIGQAIGGVVFRNLLRIPEVVETPGHPFFTITPQDLNQSEVVMNTVILAGTALAVGGELVRSGADYAGQIEDLTDPAAIETKRSQLSIARALSMAAAVGGIGLMGLGIGEPQKSPENLPQNPIPPVRAALPIGIGLAGIGIPGASYAHYLDRRLARRQRA